MNWLSWVLATVTALWIALGVIVVNVAISEGLWRVTVFFTVLIVATLWATLLTVSRLSRKSRA